MNIVILGYDHPVDDKRVWRTVRAISKRHKVVYIYRFDEDKAEKERILQKEYSYIEFIPTYMKDRSPKGIWEYDISIIKLMKEFLSADIWYFHTAPDLFPLSLFSLAKKYGIRVIYDSHELVPYELFSRFAKNKILEFGRRLVLWPIFLKQIELSDETIIVSHSIKYYINKLAPYIKTPIHVVSNYAELTDRKYWNRNREKKVVYVGWGLRPMPLWFIEELHRRYGYTFEYLSNKPIEEFRGKRWVKWYQTMPRDNMLKILSTAYFNLIIFDFANFGLNSQMSAPNKFFDALAVGVPNLVRNHFIEMVPLTHKYGVGCAGSLEELLSCADPDNPNYWAYVENIEKDYDKFVWGPMYEEKLLRIVEGRYK